MIRIGKKLLLFLSILTIHSGLSAQKLNEMPNLKFYAKANAELPAPANGEKRVVFIGNSITEGWVKAHPDFFAKNHFVGRGISGQTSPQMLLRFWADVVALSPKIVVINAGTNDIAENSGKYDAGFTLNNIRSMAMIAKSNNIKVVLASVLPAGGFKWRPEILDAPAKIDSLNSRIKDFAKANHFVYVDYNTALRDENGAMQKQYANDGVHPLPIAYDIMERIITSAIDKLR